MKIIRTENFPWIKVFNGLQILSSVYIFQKLKTLKDLIKFGTL